MELLIVLAILIISAIATQLFARSMYNRCPACNTLNAKRRTNCRQCEAPIEG